MKRTRIIALYLPQYHPTPDNDRWWGKGFTEWTNVGKAKPLFRGHLQPKVPADLGYYDLRLPEAREAQAELAREAGIEAFCYYHYWFGNGKEELELPLTETLRTGRPDFPFCLCWANESWHAKFWDKDGSIQKQLLIEQTYPGDEDIKNHFYSLLPAFKDKRYLKVNGKLFFMVYLPLEYPEVRRFMNIWNQLAKENGINGFYFVGHLVHGAETNNENVKRLLNLGFEKVNVVGLFRAFAKNRTFAKRILHKVLNIPYIFEYKKLLPDMINKDDDQPDVIPTIIPNWDHTPRSGISGNVLLNSSPDLFKKHVRKAMEVVNSRSEEESIIMLKSWNEWGEGNYMEPDIIFGKGYLKALKEALAETNLP